MMRDGSKIPTFMRIGIDARSILNSKDGDDIGVGHYTYQLIRGLLDLDDKNQYVIFFDYRVRERDIQKFSRPNVKIRFYPFSDYKKYLPGAYNELLGTATLLREHLDVLHSTSPSSRIPISYRGKSIVTLHNMGVFLEPDCYAKIRQIKERALAKYMSKKCDRVIAVSQSVKNDAIRLLGIPSSRFDVVYSGLDSRFFEDPPVSIFEIKRKFNIRKKYILFLGTVTPINNITRLLEAFQQFKNMLSLAEEEFPYQLVIAGKRGWLSQEYGKIAKDLRIAKDIVFTGYVSGDEILPLFKGAEFFTMPSLYEGFGTTILEAFAAGTPVIASKVSSLPEIAGDAVLWVNPVDIQEIAQAFNTMAQNEQLRRELREKGNKQANLFSWKTVAEETLKIYRNV